jgi:hypothetical protein
MVREGLLVQDTRCPVIQRDIRGIVSGRLFVTTELLRHISESFEGAGGLGGKRAGTAQVP